MNLTLQTGPNRLDFLVRGERFATYLPGERMPGFAELLLPGQRALTRSEPGQGTAFCLAHGNVNGIAFPMYAEDSAAAGHIVTEDLTARRGAFSVGFQQTCAWVAPHGKTLLRDVRTIRIAPGPGSGATLDLTFQLHAPEEAGVTLGRAEEAFLMIRPAAALLPGGGGQVRNSLGDYGLEAIHGRGAAWCACVGVAQGETVGFALMPHPRDPWHPVPWAVLPDGRISPSPFGWREAEIPAGGSLTLRYRLLAHYGYVDSGWADERLAEYARA